MTHALQGQLYIIAAPSGAGKTSLVSAISEMVDDLKVSISHTTRAMRPGEQDGQNYFFVDESRFVTMQQRGEFLESAKVFDHYYGTTHKWVVETLNQGIDVILEIDWQGARIARERIPQSVGIFILPPSLAALRERLKVRASDTEEIINGRMAKATQEMSHFGEFDYLIINDDFEVALQDLESIIKSQRLRQKDQATRHRDLITNLLHHEGLI